MQDHGELIARAQAWLAEDPDPETREELAKLVDAAPGSPAVLDELAARFAGTLQFGTAGLRGELGAGPLRMNRSVVIRAAAGLAAYLKGKGHTDGLVVIGYDARYKSADFARDTAAVMTGAGLRAAVLPRPLPTPVLAFAIRHLGAVAGVEVTASHNPPRDNGYKVYLGDGSQIVPPADGEIAAEIAAVRSLHDVPRPEGGWQTLGEDVLEAYLARTDAVLAQGSPRTARTVYTAMHGVGKDTLLAAFARAGFPAPVLVAEQAEPDPDFPTVAFPNPEEPGAMDLAFATAREARPDLVIANDPDADRCAVAVPVGDGDWRMLRGDEVGALLAAHLVRRGVAADGPRTFAESIVSSSLLGRIAEKAGLINLLVIVTGPLLRPLFPGIPRGHPAMGLVTLNLTANMLGLGNAATPFGIKAMEELQKLNKTTDTATNAMVMLLAMNTAGVQLLPPMMLYAVLGLRASELYIPILIVTGICLIIERDTITTAKSVASLDLLSGGRVELGLGAGAFWDAIEAMGGPRRTPGQSVEALEEAIDVIRAILRAPVDLLWNGGIGTVVKASDETDADARDRSSDAIRVDARELRARVVGEGGNLGFTRRARVEYAAACRRASAIAPPSASTINGYRVPSSTDAAATVSNTLLDRSSDSRDTTSNLPPTPTSFARIA